MKTIYKLLYSIITIVIIGIAFYFIVESKYYDSNTGHHTDSSFDESFTEVLNNFIYPQYNGTQTSILENTAVSLFHFIISFIFSILIGTSIGMVLGLNVRINRVTDYTINFFRVLPSIVFITIFKYQLQMGSKHVFFVGIIASIWPIIITTRSGASKSIITLEYSIQQLNLPHLKKLYIYTIPKAFPNIWDGVKTSLGIAFLITITCEYISPSLHGLGETLNQYENLPGSVLYSLLMVLWIGFIGIILNSALEFFERKILWLNRNIQTRNVG
jgi:ABC-type nitrate/sulfonate/bicarbonate transport system permease component